MRKLDVDFLAASSHKAFGPSGVGILYAKRERLAGFPLYQVGGGMVALNEDVVGASPSRLVPRDVPFRFEAGTPGHRGDHRLRRRHPLDARGRHGGHPRARRRARRA